MAIKKYYDSDCNLGVLDGKTVYETISRIGPLIEFSHIHFRQLPS